jgi:hypothetical protein
MYGYSKKGRNMIRLRPFNATDNSYSKINESLHKSEYSYDSAARKRKKYYERDDMSFADNDSQFNISKYSCLTSIVEPLDIENSDWKDACLKVLDRIEEYEEADDFKLPVTKEDLGEFWDDYQKLINYPIDLASIRAKIFEGEYAGVGNFEFDMRKIYDNCKKFNDPHSGIYENSNMLENIFTKLFKPVKKMFGEGLKLNEAGIRISVGGIGI